MAFKTYNGINIGDPEINFVSNSDQRDISTGSLTYLRGILSESTVLIFETFDWLNLVSLLDNETFSDFLDFNELGVKTLIDGRIYNALKSTYDTAIANSVYKSLLNLVRLPKFTSTEMANMVKTFDKGERLIYSLEILDQSTNPSTTITKDCYVFVVDVANP